MSQLQSRWLAPALLLAGVCCNLYAVDGVVLIDQNRALAGNVTPGDAPGFPVTISLPGSYRLSGNLTVPNADTTAIVIQADNVSIDLNGFSIIGPTVCTPLCKDGAGFGVQGEGHSHITVVNGHVRGMGSDGIAICTGTGRDPNCFIEKVDASSNGSNGIVIFGIVTNSTANSNGNNGIVGQGTVNGNTAIGNSLNGILVFCPSSVFGNTAFNNRFVKLSGSGPGCALSHNAAP